jgi:rfaE bifunctional protein kinase chain/domain
MLDKKVIEGALQTFLDLRVVIVGDIMLDRYIWGRVGRISPEAPVPVVEVDKEAQRPGGAGNVALNLLSLGVTCVPVGVMGNDLDGADLMDIMADAGADMTCVVCDTERPTTVKTRIIAGSQHVVRVDREQTTDIAPTLESTVLERIDKSINGAHAIILQDYNKGVMTPNVIRRAIDKGRENNIPVLVDPKARNFFEYWGADIFKPNVGEAERALNMSMQRDGDVERAAGELLARLQADHVLITRGSKGMTLSAMGSHAQHIPTRAVKIADVSGAGDTVIATLAAGVAAGMSPLDSAKLANQAAGYVVGRVGVVPVTREALMDPDAIDS